MTAADKIARLKELLASYAGPKAPTTGAQRTRARILKAATEQFQRFGYRKTSIDAVAQAAHVAKGSVYVHFENKADLLMHAIAAEKLTVVDRFAEVIGGTLPPLERLRRYLELTLTVLPEMPLTSSLLRGDRELFAVLDELAPLVRGQLEGQIVESMSMLLEGVGRFDALSAQEKNERCRAVVAVLFSVTTMHGVPRLLGLEGPRFAREVARVLVDGVGA